MGIALRRLDGRSALIERPRCSAQLPCRGARRRTQPPDRRTSASVVRGNGRGWCWRTCSGAASLHHSWCPENGRLRFWKLKLTVIRLLPSDGTTPRALVILLHGVGADGASMLPLAKRLQIKLPRAAFGLPHAARPSDPSPSSFQWVSIRGVTPANP